ncbi:MAG TPA: hypothetical protein VHC47_09765, partial [Mucilaginibacter sp.]|nr:hypothetical protein [Mucilaginibacter sp.]
GKFYQDIKVPAYNNFDLSHIIINGDSVHIESNNGRVATLTSATEKAAVMARYKLFPELDFDKPGYTMKLDSTLKIVNGNLAYQLTVTQPDGISVEYFYDQKTGLKLKQYADVANASHLEFSNYQDINTGVKIPFTEGNNVNGAPIDYKVKSATANTGLSDDTFKQ